MRANWKKILLAGAFVLLYVVPAVEQVTETFSAYMNSLPSATLAGPADLFYILQGGLSKKITTNSIFSTNLSAPPPIGNVTPNTGAFTNLSVSGTATIPGLPSSVSNSDGSLNISPTTGPVVASINPGHVNTWTVTQGFNGLLAANGPVYMGYGRPWVDVRSGANGCAAAVGDGSTDDYLAFQCQINYMASNFSGGTVLVPQGNYKIGSTLAMKNSVWLVGTSEGPTFLQTGGADITIINFDTSASNAAMDKIVVACLQASGASRSCVTIANNAVVHILNSQIFGGSFALQNNGVDGTIFNSYFAGDGTGGCGVTSQGANWYVRVKIDQGNMATTCGFQQQNPFPSASSSENHFIQCDFSGLYTNSILINDTTNQALTVFEGSVFSAPISITGAKWTSFVGAELGGNVSSSAALSISGSYGFSGITASGAGTRSCAANINITC